ncbi:MAG: hypothetical protein ACC647_09130 [Anaerolineales bacterium]
MKMIQDLIRPEMLIWLERMMNKLLDNLAGIAKVEVGVGLEQGRAPELWNLEHPDRVRSVARAITTPHL